LGRLVTLDYPTDPDVTTAYDALGRKTSVTDATGTWAYAYDGVSSRVVTVTDPDGNVLSYTHDACGERASMSLTVGTTTVTDLDYTYPPSPLRDYGGTSTDGRLTQIDAAGSAGVPTGLFSYSYLCGLNLVSSLVHTLTGENPVPLTPIHLRRRGAPDSGGQARPRFRTLVRRRLGVGGWDDADRLWFQGKAARGDRDSVPSPAGASSTPRTPHGRGRGSASRVLLMAMAPGGGRLALPRPCEGRPGWQSESPSGPALGGQGLRSPQDGSTILRRRSGGSASGALGTVTLDTFDDIHLRVRVAHDSGGQVGNHLRQEKNGTAFTARYNNLSQLLEREVTGPVRVQGNADGVLPIGVTVDGNAADTATVDQDTAAWRGDSRPIQPGQTGTKAISIVATDSAEPPKKTESVRTVELPAANTIHKSNYMYIRLVPSFHERSEPWPDEASVRSSARKWSGVRSLSWVRLRTRVRLCRLCRCS
jgi:YD repeat-containing protein